jgi:hypothetical protein
MIRSTAALLFALFLVLLTSLLNGCGNNDTEKPGATVSASFESGSIGKVTKLSDTVWELSLADDNNNAELPAAWRSWWYVKMENLVVGVPTQITLKNSGWPYYYLPVYSYDQRHWHRFSEDEVTQNLDDELIVRKKFAAGTVWIARFYPYTFTDLENFISSIASSPSIDIQVPGYTQQGRPIYLFKITDSGVPVSGKKRIFLHARTHPAETSPSFLIEGMIRYLLSGTADAAELLAGYEFYIFPMQNVDGVVAGNYRSTPKSENLEVLWTFDSADPLSLLGEVPPEVAVLQHYAKGLMTDGGPPVAMALNLHASNSEPDIRAFFYPHFGMEAQGYAAVEASLWDQQVLFIEKVMARYGEGMIEPLPLEGGGSFAAKTYPESWWWACYQDRVVAMTLEMTYGRAGYAPRWIEPDDMREFGAVLVLSIRDYFEGFSVPARSLGKAAETFRNGQLKYPDRYPPHAPDELKE